MFTKKTKPSFEERLSAAHATASNAVSVVETIALDLEDAAGEKAAVVSDIDHEVARLYGLIDKLYGLRDEAEKHEQQHRIKADKIRALVSA